jgi:hypothetical protein
MTVATSDLPAVNRKLFWLALWVTGFAVFMTGLLLYFKYQSVFTSLQGARVMMVADEIDAIAEKNLSLGQDFWEIATLQEVIERRREADPIFLGIDVAGKDGKIAYATDLARVGSSLPADWLVAFARDPRVNKLAPSADEAVVAATIRNSFDQVAGYAVVRFTRQPERDAMRAFTQRLLVTCAALFVLFTLILFATLRWLWQRTDTALAAAANAIDLGQPLAAPHALSLEVAAIESQLAAARQQLGAAAEPAR